MENYYKISPEVLVVSREGMHLADPEGKYAPQGDYSNSSWWVSTDNGDVQAVSNIRDLLDVLTDLKAI